MVIHREGGWTGPLVKDNHRYITEFDYAHPRMIVESDIKQLSLNDTYFLVRKIDVVKSSVIKWIDESRKNADLTMDKLS